MARRFIPFAMLALLLGATVWAVSFSRLPPADFVFVNETEIKSVDPAIVTGHPESRIIRELYECLVNWDPKTLQPAPGVAERWDVSEDLRTYTFHLRENALWSDGTPVTAEDFHWSYQRFLHPETAAVYAYQLYYVQGAEKYTESQIKVGDPVEIELTEPVPGAPEFARGQVVYGRLLEQREPASKDEKPRYIVELSAGRKEAFQQEAEDARDFKWLLYDFREVGIRVIDRYTLELKLDHPTPYFLQLTGFHPLAPVNRKCVETYGYPGWTKPERIVTNGPYRLKERRIRDRIRLVKSETYWNRENVHFKVVDALAVESQVTALNLYETGQCDWIPKSPNTIIPDLRGRSDFHSHPYLTTYFYRINTTRPPMNDPRVRQALNLALDKREIVDKVTRGGEAPATSFVPPGIKDYVPGTCAQRDVEEARRLLAEAGYPGGRGFPKFEILYNTLESHRAIAELIQFQWKVALNIDVSLANQEFSVFLAHVRQMQYDAARAAWIADYADPNTFLGMFVTGGENNQTGWSNTEYDALIEAAKSQPDPRKRFEIFRQAETILMTELPIIPMYYYMASELVRPDIRGFHPNGLNVHPIHAMWRERSVVSGQ